VSKENATSQRVRGFKKGPAAMVDKNLTCSWCKRSEDDVKYLIAGPGIAICDGCVADLSAILAEERSDWRDAQIERLSKLGQSKN
jgi:hypothetical protein